MARERYMEDLSPSERILFENATLENMFYGANAAQSAHEDASLLRKAIRSLEPLYDTISQ
jgi:hypothetical protein